MKRYVAAISSFFLLSGCSKLDSLQYSPPITPGEWCMLQPCVQFGNITISQPSSSVIVFILAVLSIGVGIAFLYNQNGQQSRKWWGISILLGGIGALLAGVSYQAFGYELKCAGRTYCSWTNWWELSYELLTVAGAAALLIGVSYSCFSKKWQKICKVIAVVLTIAYFALILTGATKPDKFLVSFELMVLFTAPVYIVILIINTIQYLRNRDKLTGQLVIAWLLLFATLGAYFLYMAAGITQSLWQDEIWFSENDVLHIGMLGWILYLYFVLHKTVVDKKML